MNSLSRLALAIGCSAALVGTALAADPASPALQVSFAPSEHFADAGDGPRDRRITEDELARHLQSLATRWLAPGEHLQIVVTDIDLAGRVYPTARMFPSPRVMTGGADWPRITLQYTRTAADGTVSRGEESVVDMNYQSHHTLSSEALSYEKQMLTEWFRARFGAAATAQAR